MEIAEHIRAIAAVMDDLEIEEIKIFFKASNPKRPSSETLTIEKEKPFEANFQWIAYQSLVRKEKDYYIYSVALDSSGKEKDPKIVFDSDSDWSGINKKTPSEKVTLGDIKRKFPDILKGPDLHPAEKYQTVYINTDISDKSKSYSSKEFEKNFKNDFYVVLNPKSKILENPFGEEVMLKGEKEKPEESK